MNSCTFYHDLNDSENNEVLDSPRQVFDYEIQNSCNLYIAPDMSISSKKTADTTTSTDNDTVNPILSTHDIKSYLVNNVLKLLLQDFLEKDLESVYKDVIGQLGKKQKVTSKPEKSDRNTKCGHYNKPYYAKVKYLINSRVYVHLATISKAVLKWLLTVNTNPDHRMLKACVKNVIKMTIF
jgi:hypothetical protein